MPNTVSAAALQDMLAQQSAGVMLPFLKIEHASISTIQVVYNTTAITRADGTWNPYAFAIHLPEDIEGQIPQVRVTIENADLQINDAIRSLSGVPTITFFLAMASTPDTIEAGPFVYSLKNIKANAKNITGTLGFEDDVFSQQVPGYNYIPANSPGLFR